MNETELIGAALEDPQRVLDYVTAALPAASNASQRSLLLRAQGVAHRSKGDLGEAMAAAQRAVDVAAEGGAQREEGLAWGSLGTALISTGDFERGEEALVKGCGLVDGRDRLDLDSQLAGLWARSGDIDRALAGLASAAVAAEELGALDLAADARGNRGTLLAYVGRPGEAVSELVLARQHLADLDRPVAAAQMTHNLGWVAGLQGDFQRALDLFAQAEPALAGFDFWGDTVRLLDRAEAELHAGLYRDAALDAAEAAARHGTHGAHGDQAEALLVHAQALEARGETDEAQTVAGQAHQLFEIQGRAGWAAEAELVIARCDPQANADHLVALIDRFEAANQWRSATTARLLACGAGRYDLFESIGNERPLSAPHRMLHDRARVNQLVEAGDNARALAVIRGALAKAAGERSMVASVAVRSGFSATVADLREIGASLVHNDPSALFEFAEWGSLMAAEPPPVHRPNDPDLAEALLDVRTATAAALAAEREFRDTADLLHQLRRAERRASDLQRRAPSTDQRHLTSPYGVDETWAALGGMALSRFVCFGDQARRIDLIEGVATVAPLGSAAELRGLTAEFRQAVERSLQPTRSERAATMAEKRVDELGDRLDQLLFSQATGGPLTVMLDASFAGLPWRRLRSRAGHPTYVLPTVALATRPRREAPQPLSATIIAGPSLAQAEDEANQVANAYATSIVTSQRASVAEVIQQLGNHDIVHVAAHGHLRPDQPLLSSLELHGGPLTVADLQRVQPAPYVVVLASCSAARQLPLDGNELFGMATALCSAGASYVIAAPVALPDSPATTSAMVALHRSLASGLDPSAALLDARRGLDPSAAAIADSLVLFGAPS